MSIRFMLINDRVPRGATYCDACCALIEEGESYVREPVTRLAYCDHKCYHFHVVMCIQEIEDAARSIS